MEVSCSCWCHATERQVRIKGRLVGRRQADLLEVSDCERKDCERRGAVDCMIGKLMESRWP